LLNAFNQTATISCTNKCELDEIAFCISRDNQTGLPGQSIPCPIGAQTSSDTCQKARCEYVYIPARSPSKDTDA